MQKIVELGSLVQPLAVMVQAHLMNLPPPEEPLLVTVCPVMLER